MTDYHSIRCPVCLHPFDATQHIPKVFPSCGHTICQDCLAQVLKSESEPKCPLDKLKFGRDFRKIEAFPTNFLGKELLEMKGRWNSCESHNGKKKFVCLDDHTLVCKDCVIFGDHKGHQVKQISDFEGVVKTKKYELQALVNKISTAPFSLNISIEEKKFNLIECIRKRFDHLRKILTSQEAHMKIMVNNIFLEKKQRLEATTINPAELSKTVGTKLKDFNEIMSNPNIAKMVQEDFSELSNLIEEKLISPNDKFLKELDQLSVPFEKALPSEDLLKGLNVMEALNKELQTIEAKPKLIQEISDDSILIQNVGLDINIGIFSQTLNVQSSNTEKSVTLKKPQLAKLKGLHYQLSPNPIVVDTLTSLIKHLSGIEYVSIDIPQNCSDSPFDEKALFNLVSATFSLSKNVKHIYIDVKNTAVSDMVPVYIIEKIVPEIKNLKSFSFISQNSGITTAVLKALAKPNFSQKPSLEKFKLQFSGVTLEEQAVVEFLSQAPNVKELSLGFGNTAVEDKWLDSFSTSILPSLNKVQKLEIGLSKTNLTDEEVQKLLRNLPNVTNLLVELEQTKISDASFQEFLETKVSSLTNLRNLDINLSGTNTSKDMPRLIRQAKQRVIYGDRGQSNLGLFGKISAFPPSPLCQ